METDYQGIASEKLLLIIDVRAVASVAENLIHSMFQNRNIQIRDFETLSEFVMQLQKEILLNLFDQYNDKSYLELNYVNNLANKTYEVQNTAICDRLTYNLYTVGLKCDPSEAMSLVHRVEMLLIEEICKYIPNIDERNIIIKSSKYVFPFTLYVLIEVFNKGFI